MCRGLSETDTAPTTSVFLSLPMILMVLNDQELAVLRFKWWHDIFQWDLELERKITLCYRKACKLEKFWLCPSKKKQ